MIDFHKKELFVFDLDGTLTPSKSRMEPDMGELISRLLEQKRVAVISGGTFYQFQLDFINILPGTPKNFNKLVILPTSGARMMLWKGDWHEEYAEDLSQKDKKRILAALDQTLKTVDFKVPERTYGPTIEDRGSQITFSANGQKAPLEIKKVWDPTREKREKIVAILGKLLPGFDSRVGGENSVDVTRRGINKAYGIHKLEQYLHIPIDKMLFVGDKLMLGGNDYAAKTTGVDCIQVSGPEETKALIKGWIGAQ